MNKDVVEIFTDGACKGNPGVGGWGALLCSKGKERELFGGEAHTTNNRMELLAAISALEALKRHCHVRLHTDSKYVQQGISEWIHGWKQRGWKTADKKPVKNEDLWRRLDALAAQHDIEWVWVKGHAGHDGNERADQLANCGVRRDSSTAQRSDAPEKRIYGGVRKIVLDTETTGLDPKQGHRVIELAAIELDGRKVSLRRFHRYLNPEREIDAGAAAVHGLTYERLQNEARFADIVASFLEFIEGAELIIHNAPFDIGFLNHELELLGLPSLQNEVTDTLKVAREMHPGKKNSLDALCSRYEVDNAHRTLHGALLDTELLAEVYFAMTRGQKSLLGEDDAPTARQPAVLSTDASRPALRVLQPSAEELAEHTQQLADIDKASKGSCLWLQLEKA